MLLLFFSARMYCQNLAVNPGFEDWEKVTRPAGWSHVEKCTKDSNEVHSGKYSCKHTGLSSTSDLGQNIAVTPGVDYTLSLFYKTGVPSEGNGSRIRCYWKDSGGNSISDPATDDIMRPGKYLKSSVWAQFSITVKAPETASTFYLEVRTNSNSMIYWDDFLFCETAPLSIKDESNLTPSVFPNPTHDFIMLRNISGSICAELIDVNGLECSRYDTRSSDETSVPTELLKPGIYFLRIVYPKRTIVIKIIKE